MYTGGRAFGVIDRLHGEAGYAQMKKLSEQKPKAAQSRAKIDNVITFDKLTDVFNSGTMHDEDQVPHLHVADTSLCATRCVTDFGNPCTNFCPANVYEMIPDGAGGTKLQINSSNCVHCKACDIKEPYDGQITWVTPEGGSGPNYQSL